MKVASLAQQVSTAQVSPQSLLSSAKMEHIAQKDHSLTLIVHLVSIVQPDLLTLSSVLQVITAQEIVSTTTSAIMEHIATRDLNSQPSAQVELMDPETQRTSTLSLVVMLAEEVSTLKLEITNVLTVPQVTSASVTLHLPPHKTF